MMSTALIMSAALVLLSVAFDTDTALTSSTMLIPGLIWTFMAAYSTGYGPVTYVLMGEMFPLSVKAMGCTAAFTWRFLVNASQLKVYPAVMDSIGKVFEGFPWDLH